MTCLADVEAKPVEWLWRGRIPAGMLTILDGDPGLGKSLLLKDLAARVSTGRPMPGETERTHAAGVVWLTAEDSLEYTVRPRLDAAGVDSTRIVAVRIREGRDDERKPVIRPADLSMIQAAAGDVRARLVVFDPLMAYLPSEVNSHRDQDVRRALSWLRDFAARTGAAVVVIRSTRLRCRRRSTVAVGQSGLSAPRVPGCSWPETPRTRRASARFWHAPRPIWRPCLNRFPWSSSRPSLAFRRWSGVPCPAWMRRRCYQTATRTKGRHWPRPGTSSVTPYLLGFRSRARRSRSGPARQECHGQASAGQRRPWGSNPSRAGSTGGGTGFSRSPSPSKMLNIPRRCSTKNMSTFGTI